MTEYIIVKINGFYYLAQQLELEKDESLGKLNVSQLETIKKFEDRQDMLDFLGIMDILYKDSLKESKE